MLDIDFAFDDSQLEPQAEPKGSTQENKDLIQSTTLTPIKPNFLSGFCGGLVGGAIAGGVTAYATTVAMMSSNLQTLETHVGSLKNCLDQLIHNCKLGSPSNTTDTGVTNPPVLEQTTGNESVVPQNVFEKAMSTVSTPTATATATPTPIIEPKLPVSLPQLCQNLIASYPDQVPSIVSESCATLESLAAQGHFSVEDLTLIDKTCQNLAQAAGNVLPENYSSLCQNLFVNATQAFVDATCQGSSPLFTQACSGIAHHAISSSSDPQNIMNCLAELKGLLSPEVLTQAQVQDIATQCHDLTQHFVDLNAIQEIQTACQTIVAEAASKVAYSEMIGAYSLIGLDFLNQYLAQPIAYTIATGIKYGIFKPIEYAAYGIEVTSSFAKENISSEGVASACETAVQAMEDHPWITLGVGLGVVVTGTSAAIYYRHRNAPSAAKASEDSADLNTPSAAKASEDSADLNTPSAAGNSSLTFLYSARSTVSREWKRLRGGDGSPVVANPVVVEDSTPVKTTAVPGHM